MRRDAKKMRGEGPFCFTNLKSGEGADEVAEWVLEQMTLPRRGVQEAVSYVRPHHGHTHMH
jgi:urease accessory protein